MSRRKVTTKSTPTGEIGRKIDHAERAAQLAADYLVHRDGMDPQLAMDVVAGMDIGTVDELIVEANTALLDTITDTITKGKEANDGPVPDFMTIPGLASDKFFPELVINCADASKRKNSAEKEYKQIKKMIIATMESVNAKAVECMGIKLNVYVGHTVTLDEHLLLEAGVPADTIKRCWKDTPYTDVRVMAPKEK